MLGLPPSAAGGEATQVVVVALAGAVIGLVVDRTRAILRVDPDRVDPLPAIMQRGSGEAEILAICRLDSGRRLVSILSADQLFREETMRRIKAEHTERGSPSGAESAGGVEEQFVVFQLAGEEYGLPIAAVDEVARVPAEMTRVPKAPAFVEGVMNLRGQVVPLIDQRRRFDLPERARDEGQRVIVINMDGARTGFIVDGVSQILKAPAESIGPAPDMSDEQTRLFSRVINLEADGRMILLLDPRELLDRTERRLLSALDDGELRSATP
jgi:purine-binding chemotaxis protein CheW